MNHMELDDLLLILEKETSFLLAIDGMCGSGKTSLAAFLQQRLHAHVFHMDDFFLPAHLRTLQRYQTPGGNIHYERFLKTVLKPLSHHQAVNYQPFDCATMTLRSEICIPYQPRNIIEGSYALHPSLCEYYSHALVLKISEPLQKERLKRRNQDRYEQFVRQWIPLENQYFAAFHLFERYPVIENLHIFSK